MSAAFERFRFSFFEDPNSAREGLDLVPLTHLADDERDRAEDMLLSYLPDTRAVIGLGVLRSRRTEGKLVRLFEAEEPAAKSPPVWSIWPKRCGESVAIGAGLPPSSRCSPAAICGRSG